MVYKSNKNKPRYKPKTKQKIEFSKKWLIGCIVISLFFTTFSYILAIFDKNTVENLSISIIEMLWGASGISFIGYVLQNSVRAFSANKFGISKEDVEIVKTEEFVEEVECEESEVC